MLNVWADADREWRCIFAPMMPSQATWSDLLQWPIELRCLRVVRCNVPDVALPWWPWLFVFLGCFAVSEWRVCNYDDTVCVWNFMMRSKGGSIEFANALPSSSRHHWQRSTTSALCQYGQHVCYQCSETCIGPFCIAHLFCKILPIQSRQSCNTHILVWGNMYHQLVFPGRIPSPVSLIPWGIIGMKNICNAIPQWQRKYNLLLWCVLPMNAKCWGGYSLFFCTESVVINCAHGAVVWSQHDN